MRRCVLYTARENVLVHTLSKRIKSFSVFYFGYILYVMPKVQDQVWGNGRSGAEFGELHKKVFHFRIRCKVCVIY